MDDAGTPQRPSHRRTVVDAVVVAVLWLAVVGRVDPQEVVAAVLTGTAAALFGARVRRRLGHEGRLPRGTWRVIVSAVSGAVTDTWPLTRALVWRLGGAPSQARVREVPFSVGGDDAADVGRRAVATVTCSLQPNSYLIGFDDERDIALVHELVPTDDPPIHPMLRGRP